MRFRTGAVLLLLIGLVIYTNTIFNSFVGDDFHQIVNNTYVYSLTNIPKFFLGSTYESGGIKGVTGLFYRPIMMTVFTILYAVFGPNPAVYHLFQILLHILNSILVFILLTYFIKKNSAFFIAVFFLIHPINTEAVVYIANLQEMLFFFFGMLSLLALFYIRKQTWIVLFFLFLLSLLAKESGVLFICISIIYTFLFLKRNTKRTFFVGVSAFSIYLLLRFLLANMQTAHESIAPISQANVFERMVNIPFILTYYLKMFFFPLRLGSHYFWFIRTMDIQTFFLPLVFITTFFILLFTSRFLIIPKVSRRQYDFFLLWFLSGVILHIQLIPLDATVADRWFYFPFIGLSVCLYFIFKQILGKNVFRLPVAIVLVLLFFVFGIRSFIRIFDWRGEITLYAHDISVSKNFILANALATAYITNGEYKKAKPYVEMSIQEYPYYANINNMGIIYASEKNIPKAKEYFKKAVDTSDSYMVYENYSSFLMLYNFNNEARLFTKEALKTFPRSARLWFNEAKLLKEENNVKESLNAAFKAYNISGSEEHSVFYEELKKSTTLSH